MFPGNKLTEGCLKNCETMTESLHIGKYIGEVHVFVTHTGAKQQSYHCDSDTYDAITVIHVITKRFIWVKDKRGERLIKLDAGDILLMHGDCYHAGAANEYKQKTYALFVSVGFYPKNTFPCGLDKLLVASI